MRALIHIGMPKTGSSAIQSWLETNRLALAKEGVAYSRAKLAGRAFDGAHVELAICLHNELGQLMPNRAVRAFYRIHNLEDQNAFADKYRKHFEATVAKLQGDVCVLSSEYLGAGCRSAGHIEALKQWLAPIFDDTSFVIYFRRQEDIAASAYSQRIKRGTAKSLDEVIRYASDLDYYAIAARWQSCVGRDHLNVRLLEPDVLTGGELISDFAGLLGLNVAGFSSPPDTNTALSHPAIELLRALNAKAPSFLEDGSRNPVSRQIRRDLAKEDAKHAFPGLKLSRSQVKTVRTACHDSNEKLRAAFFPERQALFPERPRSKSEAKNNAALAAQVAELSAALYARRLPKANPTQKVRTGLGNLLHRVGLMP